MYPRRFYVIVFQQNLVMINSLSVMKSASCTCASSGGSHNKSGYVSACNSSDHKPSSHARSGTSSSVTMAVLTTFLAATPVLIPASDISSGFATSRSSSEHKPSTHSNLVSGR